MMRTLINNANVDHRKQNTDVNEIEFNDENEWNELFHLKSDDARHTKHLYYTYELVKSNNKISYI